MTIRYITPFSTDLNIGGEYNARIAETPDDDGWIAITDADAMFLTPKYGQQIEEVCRTTDYDLLGCVTNRLARKEQLYQGKFSDDFNIINHHHIALALERDYYAQVTPIKRCAGVFMLFKRRLWNKIKFHENTPYFDDVFSHEVMASCGKIGMIKGLYMFHCYRALSKSPIFDRRHLQK